MKSVSPSRNPLIRSKYNSAHYSKNKEVINKRHKDYIAQCKAIVFTAYGNKCACKGCNCDWEPYLQLDHINNDGGKFRKTITKSGHSTWVWLIKYNFPSDVQLLCANCHTAKTRNKPCNHAY